MSKTKTETNSGPIPDTPECVSGHLGVYACRPDEIRAMHALILSGTVAAKNAAEMDAAVSAPAEYAITSDGVAIIPVRGIMQRAESKFGGVVSTVRVRRMMRDARGRTEVRGVLLSIDSPGGAVAGQTELIDELDRLMAAKPVWSAVDEMACSAAYWLAAKTGHIAANRLATVANIGCYCIAYDETKKQERDGIRVVLVSTGKFKGLGADGSVPDELVSEMQKGVEAINVAFCADVAAGRGMDEARVTELADGRWYSGREAVELGFVDTIANFDEALAEFSAYLNNKQEENEMEESKQLDAFKALADSDGYEFAKANYGKPEHEIALARKDAKIAALEEENRENVIRIADLETENAKLKKAEEEKKKEDEEANDGGEDEDEDDDNVEEESPEEEDEKNKDKGKGKGKKGGTALFGNVRSIGAEPVGMWPAAREESKKKPMFSKK